MQHLEMVVLLKVSVDGELPIAKKSFSELRALAKLLIHIDRSGSCAAAICTLPLQAAEVAGKTHPQLLGLLWGLPPYGC